VTDNAAWFAARMARETGAPAQYVPPQQLPPVAPPQQQYPQQYQQQPAPQPISEQAVIQAARNGEITAFQVFDYVAQKGGGKGARTERDVCPECGSNHYFQRKAASKMGHPPAPYCHACGYNGMYEQFGTMEVPMTPEG
jgi:predicted nucleic-acid-binding Zn-ribbon protein